MTEHYVTLFDSTFLPQGLALHHSLKTNGGDFLLWILCLDTQCHKILSHLKPDNVKLLLLDQYENDELRSVKLNRSISEYCWTLTPWSVQWVFEADPSAPRVTYLDADTYFLKTPAPIFNELDQSGKKVLITEHGFAPEYDQSDTAGRFCVQFTTFLRGDGQLVLDWWKKRCMEWCYSRTEDGKFGDQMYLNHFSRVFPGSILETSNDPRFQAPWNACIFPYSKCVFFHYHGLRIAKTHIQMASPMYRIPYPTLHFIYKPYCELIESICSSEINYRPIQKAGAGRKTLFMAQLEGFRRQLRNWIACLGEDLRYRP